MQRLYFLVMRCYNLHEPVLFVGDTGGGKTTVCQFLSAVLQIKLQTLNCHQYTESSDFLGNIPLDITSGSSTLNHLKKILLRHNNNPADFPDVTEHDLHELDDIKLKLTHLQQKWHTLFIRQDGPLVEAMKEGHLFLLDEISLLE